MKRLRDDVYVNPQLKRHFGPSRGESNGQSQGPGGGGAGSGVGGSGGTQRLTTNDALTYLKEVKDMFRNQREKYDTFLDVMKDFKAQRIDTAGVIARVKELFSGHPNLILGFNTFLPKGYEITLTDVEEAPPKRTVEYEEAPPRKTVEFEEAISFVNKIKSRFRNEDQVYKSFLDILNMYRKEHKSINEVYQEVAVLFIDHADLLDEFTRFLPDPSGTAIAAHPSFGRHSFHRFDERSSAMASLRHPLMDKQRFRRDRIVSPHAERDLSVEGPDMDDDKTMMKLHKEQIKRAEKDHREKRNHDLDCKEPIRENNWDGSQNPVADKRKSARKNEEFGGSASVAAYEEKDSLRSKYSQEFSFCDKVKERLHDHADYQAFLKCLHIYSTEIITRKELRSLVGDLLGKYPDLMEGFTEFLERCERIDGFLGVVSKKSLWNEGASKSVKCEDKEREHKREMDKEKERCKEKYWQKSIQELDLSDCQRCGPSYRLLPEDYPIPPASQRSELGNQVLNDHWVSVTSGSEDYSFKHMRRNQYEESLFKCEDDRFELDMLIESVSSTTKRAEELLNSMNNCSTGVDVPIRLEDQFTALNLRCIERLYGDHGLDVTEILRRNPSLSLPVIINRLKQKQEEWTKSRQDFNKVWAEIYAKNHYKSLDHRSFYFKQQDSKNLSAKSLVVEIKEIKEKNQKGDDVLLAISAGTRHHICPNLVYEYDDPEIHEDLYKLIKYSCEEVCSTKEQLNKVMRLWTSFLETMMGVSPQPRGSEANDALMILRASKNNETSIGETDGSPAVNATDMISNTNQSKPVCNGNTSPTRVASCRTSFTNAEALTKHGITIDSSERLATADGAVTSGTDTIRGKASTGCGEDSFQPGNSVTEDGHGIRSNVDGRPSSEAADTSRLLMMANGGFAEGSRMNVYKENTSDAAKNEKEEGELSPNGDLEEDNFVVYRDGNSQAMPNINHGDESMQYKNGGGEEIRVHDAPRENDADADDEDSEHVSEAGEDISGSESVADECSREEHEEEEDGEPDELHGKAESEGEAENISETHGGDGMSLPSSERIFQTSRPLTKHVASSSRDNEKKSSGVFYGNDTFYVLFRLHQALYERLLSAKQNSGSLDSKWKSGKDKDSDPYSRFMRALYSLLDGSADNTKFEDDCRAIIGNQSYALFTLDKLIYKLVKQLQIVSSEELDSKLLQLYDYERSRGPGKYIDSVYYENAHVLLHEENIYRFERTSPPTRLSIQLMDEGNEKSEVVAVSVDPNFASYLHNDYLAVSHGKKESSTLMLKRNKQKYADLEDADALCMAMEDVLVVNGLECKMAAASSKISYVLDTEDFFFRLGTKRSDASSTRPPCQDQARLQRFHQFLDTSLRHDLPAL